MKIAIANNLYYPYNRGGAETVVKNMITGLKAEGHEVFLITTRPKKEIAPINPDLKIYYSPSDYSRLAEFSEIRKIFWHFSNIFSFRKTAAIANVLKTEKPNLILTHNLMGLGFRLPQAIKRLKINHEHYLHDIQLLYPSGLMMLDEEKIIDGLSAKIYQLFTRAFFGSPAKIISPSNWLLEQHKQRGFFSRSEMEVRNLIKVENNGLTAESLNKKNGQKDNFLFVGQIEYHKGIIFLINAFKKALTTNPEIKLTIIGDGTRLEEAKKICAGEKQIEFLGRLESAGVQKIMRESDCLIIPSLCYENAPTTIFESHAVGLSVLAASIGGIPEIISPGDKLFKPGDENDLMKKIIEIAKK